MIRGVTRPLILALACLALAMPARFWPFARPAILTLLSVTALLTGALLLSRSPAGANHIAGATYTGTVEGGGTISFTVAADGTQIDSLTVQNVPAGGCPDTTFFNIPIVDHTFFRPGGSSISGSFPSPGDAEGTLSLDRPSTTCDANTRSWTAMTGGTPTPSPSPTPGPGQRIWGDSDCGGAFNIGDAINTARKLINLAVNAQPGCPVLGAAVTAAGIARIWGDTDCGGAFNIGDAINVARKLINLVVNQQPDCPILGTVVVVSG